MKIRLFLQQKLASGNLLTLEKAQAHYVKNVLRAKPGREIFVFNADDGEFVGAYDGGQIRLGEQTITPLAEPKIALIFAPVKFGKIDMLAEKATELGVTDFFPIKTQYTQMTRINYDRLQANAVEAAEQTGRISVPQVHEIQPLEKLIDGWNAEQKIVFCDETLEGQTFKKVVSEIGSKNVAFLLGPEGGFAPEETKFLRSKDFVFSASMGKRLLRAETAALAALAAYQAINGDWN